MSFSLNNKIYVGGGYAGNLASMKDFWEYDPALDLWTRKKDLPGANRTAGIGFAVNGKGYIGLGSTNYNTFSATFRSDLWQYDPAADNWTLKQPLPDSGRHHAACFVVGNKAYVVGGNTGYPYDASNDLWQYDATNDTWTSMAPYPATYVYNAMGFAIGNDGYIVGGHVKAAGSAGNGRADSATYKYNTLDNTWTRKANLCRGTEGGVGFSINGIGYTGFGMYQDTAVTLYFEEFCKYHPATDSWDSAASFPNIAREYAIAAVANGKAYAGAGFIYLGSEVYKNDWAELNVGSVGVAAVSGSDIAVYPNPADGIIRIRSAKSTAVHIYNMYGQCVRSLVLSPGLSTIDVAALPAGLYKVSTPSAAYKILVQH
jgi:N-acetylneuraminic acid mutarotase